LKTNSDNSSRVIFASLQEKHASRLWVCHGTDCGRLQTLWTGTAMPIEFLNDANFVARLRGERLFPLPGQSQGRAVPRRGKLVGSRVPSRSTGRVTRPVAANW